MKHTLPLAGLLSAALLTISAAAAEPDTIEKAFTVKPGGKLVMKVDRGSIRVNAAEGDKVQVKVVRELRKGSDRTARDIYAQHKIEMAQDGDVVSIVAERGNVRRTWFSDPLNQLRVEYTISVPSEFNLELRTAGGNIGVSDLVGEVRANTAGGNLDLGTITGPIHAETSGGNISARGSKGKTFLRTSGGDVRLDRTEGDLTAKTSGGNISIHEVKGRVNAQTSGGHIEVREAHGPIYAHTSGGNVSAALLLQPAADCELSTSGGNVALTLAQQVAVDVEARTSGGRIRSDFAGQMNKSRTKLVAQINGGGPSVVLSTSGGNVEVRKR